MARILAVDWDQHEARYVLATTSGATVKIRHADCVSLVDVSEGGGEPRPDLGGSLAAALADQNVGRATALVGVERSSIELLRFTLPPAKDQELPELVANQAMRQSQLITEDSVLDFVPADDDPARPRDVTAAAISPQEIERIRRTCAAAGFTPARLLLRPFAAASLFLRTASPPEQVFLLVNRMAEEVDLTIIVEGKTVFSRTVRLPEGADPAQVTNRLVTEVNRTLAAAPPKQLGGDTIECVYLFGSPEDHQELIERIRDDLFLPAKTFDPFEPLDVPGDVVPEDRGRFAALLGMILDEVDGRHAIDFLHPRKIPKPPNRARLAAIAGGIVAVVIFGIAFNIWGRLSEIDDHNQQLSNRLKQLNETLKKAGQQQKLIDAVSQWKARDICWLDELRDLSIRFPSARDAMVLRMSLTSQSGGAIIDLQGLVRDPRVVYSMEAKVRDQYRSVRSPRAQERLLEKDYTWLFETSVSVAQRHKDRYVSHLPQQPEPPEEPEPRAERDRLADAGASDTVPQVRKASQ